IGYGKVGKIRHECIKSIPHLELMGICDTDRGAVRGSGVPYYSDHKKLLDESPDMVFVCTYNCYIPGITIEAISLGIHVFSEKPPGKTLEDVKAIRDTAKRNPDIKIKFGFNHRYHEGIIEAKSIVNSGRLGKIMWMRGVYGKAGGPGYDNNWRNDRGLSGGGILIDQGIHMLDLFRYFCGEYDEIKSFIGSSYWQVDVEDNVFAILRNSKTGQTAMIHSSATQWRHKFLLEVYMEKGYLEIDGILSSTRTYGRETLKTARCVFEENGYPLPNPQETMTYYNNDNSWTDEINDFVDCIIHDKPICHGSIEDAIMTMDLVQRIYNDDDKWGLKTAYRQRIDL
ncbi:MAG: Gfo/Idh/MocA family oxidoreductase, partial [Bacteroidia bacterium]|nr:Gfo/Idh/MocA family oxidoreductase [Bacteroidia bacterium]